MVRAISVTFAAKPVALGAADVPPDRLTVRPVQLVVPLVPSSAASDTRIPSTEAWLSA